MKSKDEHYFDLNGKIYKFGVLTCPLGGIGVGSY